MHAALGCFFDSRPARQDGGIERFVMHAGDTNGRAACGIHRLGRLLDAAYRFIIQVSDHQRNDWHGILARPQKVV